MSEINQEQPWNALPRQIAPARRPLAAPPLPKKMNDGRPLSIAASPVATDTGQLGADPAELTPGLHPGIILGYFIICFGAQLLLLLPQFLLIRIPLRMAPFALSMLLAVFLPDWRAPGQRMHSSLPLAVIILVIMVLGLFNQLTDSTVAGAAQIGLCAAILSPLLWVGRLRLSARGVGAIVLCLWSFNAASAGVGVLQTMFPGRFQSATSSVVQDLEEQGISYSIELADGAKMERPYGLTDQPGGAATAGLAAYIFGLALLVSSRNNLMRAVYLGGMGVGLFIMYLSQVRMSLVMSGIATIAFFGIMAARGEFARLTGTMIALTFVIVVSTSLAFTIGGQQTRDRLFTLVDNDAGSVYQSNRGRFLEYTFYYTLPNFPMGSGLGRYGMMSVYFNKGPSRQSLWAEIQWDSWAYDGGYLLIIAYPAAILIALWFTLKTGINRTFGPVGLWAAVLTAYNVSVCAVLFSYSYFNSQFGLEFWVLNAAVFSAAQVYRSRPSVVPEGFEVLPAPWQPKLAPPPLPDAPTISDAAAPRRRPLQQRPLPTIVPILDSPNGAEGHSR